MKIFVLFLILLVPGYTAAQTCITKEETHKSWSYIPYLDGDNSRIVVQGHSDEDNPTKWFEGDYTLDMWVKCRWDPNHAYADDRYFFFSVSTWGNDHHNYHFYFSESSNGGWRIQLSDGHNAGSNADLRHEINYSAEFYEKWKHLTVTFKENGSGDVDDISLYIDGSEVASKKWDMGDIPHWHITFGENNNPSNDFRGHLSGIRVWDNYTMSAEEVNYIYDKTFNHVETFAPGFDHLHQYLAFNVYTNKNGVESLVPIPYDIRVEEATPYTDIYHPARPERSYNLSTTGYCDHIRLDWTKGDYDNTTCYIYRREAGDTYWGDPICHTNDNYFEDWEGDIQTGIDYEYMVKTMWHHPEDPLKEYQDGYIEADPDQAYLDEMTVTTSLRKYPKAENFRVTEDASSANCQGQVKLSWDPISPAPTDYYIQYKYEGQAFTNLVTGLTGTSYTHDVANTEPALLGKKITYRVDGGGDGCTNYSDEISGIANTKSTSTPSSPAASVAGSNIEITWDYTHSTGGPATGFRIYRKVTGGSWEIIRNDINVDSRTYTDQTAKICVDYEYSVEAYNSCNQYNVRENASISTGIITLPSVFNNVFTYDASPYFDGSKGYYNSKIELEWEVNPDKVADIEKFEIYRSKPNQTYTLLTEINNANATTYSDQSSEANQMYEYLIRAHSHCGASEIISDSLTCLGFRTSTGIVSGKITYEGGNAVPDVEVRISTENPVSASSLLFNGNSDYLVDEVDGMQNDSMVYNSLTFEAWIKPDSVPAGYNKLIFSEDALRLNLYLNGMVPHVVLNDSSINETPMPQPLLYLVGDTILPPSTWHHLAFTLDLDSMKLNLYLNGDLLNSVSSAAIPVPWGDATQQRVQIGGTMVDNMGMGFSGNIDEVRLWKKAKTAKEIKRDYTRILAGNEKGLLAYWRFDENYGNYSYDLSKAGSTFNKNNLSSSEFTMPDWSSQTPSFEQLHPSGVSNARGNYTIEGINYGGNGQIFNLSPILGVHEFDPPDMNLFIGDDEPVHNNINFTDVSSFRVTGAVAYRNTDFPVENADIYVDNKQVFDAGGYPVQTNQYGEFDIQVPIGDHYVSVKKDGHIFENSGQWPEPTANLPYKTHNFLDDVYNLKFSDSTIVKIAGRFAGDDVEGNKKLGFSKSKNNIGVGTIIIENEQGFDITFDSQKAHASADTFKTGKQTGEYEVWLLPERYVINYVGNNHYQMDNNDLGVLDLRKIPDITVIEDTTTTEEVDENGDTTYIEEVDDYEYHFKRNFIHYSRPEIVVENGSGDTLTGDKRLIFKNPETEELDTVDLINNSPFQYPVYTMGKAYDIDIYLQAVYYNHDDPDTTIKDVVPVAKAEVTIANNLEAEEPVQTFRTDAEGHVSGYPWFRVGAPNLAKDVTNAQSFTKTMTITARYHDFNDVTWAGNEGNLYRAYVLGHNYVDGANFVTYGPEIPEFILRDPPGSNSYTYLEKESGYSVSNSYDFSFGSGSHVNTEVNYGSRFEAGGGLAGPVFEMEIDNILNAGVSTANAATKSGEVVESYRFNKRYETSSNETAVGSMADVYIGKSYNLFFTETSNLRILPKDHCTNNNLDHLDSTEIADNSSEYTLGIKTGFAVTDDSSSTYFIYSQDHIMNSLLPEYREMIFDLLANDPNYESKISRDHIYYGLSNDAPCWKDTIDATGDDKPSYLFLADSTKIDSIAFLNQQISVWMQTIALNEAAKVEADKYVENISIDGNAGSYTSEVSYTSVSKEKDSYSFKFQLFGGSKMGFNVNNFGVQTVNKTHMEWDRNLAFNEERTRSMKYGYVIDDGDMSDYYSIDVKMDSKGVIEKNVDNFLTTDNKDDFAAFHSDMGINSAIASIYGVGLTKIHGPIVGQVYSLAKTITFASAYLGEMGTYRDDIDLQKVQFGLNASSPIFSIRGGNTSCPYEPPEQTIFYMNRYNEPYTLHVGTQPRENPIINIEPQMIVNVPDGEKAAFDLKLTNASETDHDWSYNMQVDEDSNPDGAIIKVDGISPNRSFFIQAGKTLTKTLTVESGASGVMDYDNLQLIFHSGCQYDPQDNFPDIADSVEFSAHFIPTCTDVAFGNLNDDWVANVYNNDTLPLNITGYDLNSSGFEKIWLQHAQPGANPVTDMIFYKNEADYLAADEPKSYLNGEPEVDFDLDISGLNDGKYNMIVKTGCADGSVSQANPVPGTIDRVRPRNFGAPQPADGILSPGDEISLLYNEKINAGDLYTHKSYIQVRGVVNGTDLKDNTSLLHDASLHFDGDNDYMVVNNGINLDHTSFTIEFWAKRDRNGKECLVSLGRPGQDGLWIGFDANDHFVFQLGNQTLTSDRAYAATGSWAHYACVFNAGDESTESGMTAIVSADASTEEKYLQAAMFTSLEAKLYAGFCSADSSAFMGNMHELRIWNTYRTIDEVSPQKSKIMNGYEQGLYGLWPMDDAYGKKARDIAFGRSGVVNATWHVSRNGKSLVFDGSSYASTPTGSMVFESKDDFTIEFWFKTDPAGQDVCLLSNGKGDGTLNSSSWNIMATSDKNIEIYNNGKVLILEASKYLTNNWHHLALSLNRIGYLSVYLDGELVKTASASQFEGFGSSQLVLGAKWYYLSGQDHYSSYMTGEIDELRVWNSSKSQKHIQRYMNHALYGYELGLKAYFPFEDTRIEDPSVSNETLENLTENTQSVAGNMSLGANAAFSIESPNIKLQKPEVDLPFDYVINEDELIITPTMEAADIENTILTIAVQRVKDMYNNQMGSVISWTAFVDKNQVVWDKQNLAVEKKVNEEVALSVDIQNKSGVTETFNVKNIPSWMEVTPAIGTLNPQEKQTIELIIKPGMNIGKYSHDLHLISSMGYNERLVVQVKVSGEEPDWTVDADQYDYSANLIGQVRINSIFSTDPDDKVAVFINEECRGVFNIQYLESSGAYLVFLNIYDNKQSGNAVHFKVYDASTGEVYSEVMPVLEFEQNMLYGEVSEPVVLEAETVVDQSLALSQGWNWISFNVYDQRFENLNQALAGLEAEPADVIKSSDRYAQYSSNNKWQGSLQSLHYKEMYKLNTQTAQTFQVSGKKLIPDTVSLSVVKGWNWIGFPAHNTVSVKEALSSLNPSEGDLLKSQKNFAVFDPLMEWVGNLSHLHPGKGYMLFAQKEDQLVYSGNTRKASAIANDKQEQHLSYTASNMTMIARLALDHPGDYTLKAYRGNTLCGLAEAVSYTEAYPLFFITLNGVEEGPIRLEAEKNDTSFAAEEQIVFSPDVHLGELARPYVLHFERAAGIKHIEGIDGVKVYPNPFEDRLRVEMNLTSAQNIHVTLLNVVGTKVYDSGMKHYQPGYHSIDLSEHVSSIPAGVYILSVKNGSGQHNIRIIKQNNGL